MRIAMVSEHASPLAALGGADAGGQNVHVLELSSALADAGHEVTVWTRRDAASLPDGVPLRPGVVVRHVTAGPAEALPKDDLVPHLPAFTRELEAAWAQDRPDVVHAHFWMSGMVALAAAAGRMPVVQTFHALGAVKRRHQGSHDTSPEGRVRAELAVARQADRVLATCTDEVFELARMGAPRRRMTVVPCGVDTVGVHAGGPRRAAGRPAAAGVDRPARAAQGRRRGHRGTAPPPVRRAGGRGRGRRRRPGRRTPARVRVPRRRGGPGAPDRSGGPSRRARAAALGRRRGLRAVVRAVRDRAAARRWPAAARSWRARSGGSRTPWSTRSPACWCRRAVPTRSPRRCATCSGSPTRAAAFGIAGRDRVLARYGWERVAVATQAVYEDVIDARGGRRADDADTEVETAGAAQ